MKKICKSIIPSFLSLVLLGALFVAPAKAIDGNIDTEYSSVKTELGFNQAEFEAKAAHLLSIILENAADFEISTDALRYGSVGDPICAYEYVDGNLQQLAFVQYPFIYDNKVVFFLVYDGESVNLSRLFTDKISEAMQENKGVAFVYDADSCYLVEVDSILNDNAISFYTDETTVSATRIYTNNEDIAYRDTFTDESAVAAAVDQAEPCFVEISPSESTILPSNTVSAYAVSPSVQAPVSTVLQPSGSEICWAASVACIGNKLTGKSITAIAIAKSVYGNDYNHGANDTVAMNALYNNYNVRYPFVQNAAPSDSIITLNLSSNKPVYSHWRSNYDKHHAAVIWGIYAPSNSNSILYVMDPANGKITVSKNSSGKYVNVSPSSGSWSMMAFASYSIS